MRAPSTGAESETEEEEVDGFYQAVSLDDLLAGSWANDEEESEEDGVAGAAPSNSVLPESVSSLPPDPRSLAGWIVVYYRDVVAALPKKTEAAKRADLERFLNFVVDLLGHDGIDAWVPELTIRFQEELRITRSLTTGRVLQPATVNRILSTVRQFATWVGVCRGARGAALFEGVRRLPVRRRPNRSLTKSEVTRLWRTCQARVETAQRRDQNPLLEAALLQVLVGTDLRPGELSAMDLVQYHSKALHGAFRRGRRMVSKRSVPAEARRWLDRYLKEVRGRDPGALFLARGGRRLSPAGISRLLSRLAKATFPGELWSRGVTPASIRAIGRVRFRQSSLKNCF